MTTKASMTFWLISDKDKKTTQLSAQARAAFRADSLKITMY